jgi:hypothetical protein
VKFMGEEMICILCGKIQQSDPAVESGWLYVEIDGQGFYVCPDHQPKEREIYSTKAWTEFYKIVILKVLEQRKNNPK